MKPHVKTAIMEPLSIIRDTMSHIIKEHKGILMEGILQNFSALRALLEIRRIDVIFSELYDENTTIIEGIEFLRSIKYKYPNLEIVVHTEIEIPALIVNSNADAIYLKNTGMTECELLVSNILRFETPIPILFYKERIINYDYETLTTFEWDILKSFSKFLTISQIANYFNVSYTKVVRIKRNIMKKLNISDSIEFSKLMVIANCKFGDYPPDFIS